MAHAASPLDTPSTNAVKTVTGGSSCNQQLLPSPTDAVLVVSCQLFEPLALHIVGVLIHVTLTLRGQFYGSLENKHHLA